MKYTPQLQVPSPLKSLLPLRKEKQNTNCLKKSDKKFG
jgi:hypothetical protein